VRLLFSKGQEDSRDPPCITWMYYSKEILKRSDLTLASLGMKENIHKAFMVN